MVGMGFRVSVVPYINRMEGYRWKSFPWLLHQHIEYSHFLMYRKMCRPCLKKV